MSNRGARPLLNIGLNFKVKSFEQQMIRDLGQVAKTFFRQLFTYKENEAEIRFTAL